MSRSVSIVMYHYVRDLNSSRYPSIKARTVDEFRFQIDYLSKIGTFISKEELIDSVLNGSQLPENAVMVSFDDGYIDHYENALPILFDRKIEGMFFPPAEPIITNKVLDVNKIHFIIASEPDINSLVKQISTWTQANSKLYQLTSFDEMWAKYAKPSIYDNAATVFVKFILQRGLPKTARNALVSILFSKYVSHDEAGFSAELYMSKDQIRMMSQCGQYIGSHGYSHEWLDMLDTEEQELEISESVKFLNSLGIATNNWIMCYPYGCYPYSAVNEQFRALLTAYGCGLALTDHGGVANIDTDDKFMIRRIDTNEIPIR